MKSSVPAPLLNSIVRLRQRQLWASRTFPAIGPTRRV